MSPPTIPTSKLQAFVWTTSTKGITTLAEAWAAHANPGDNRNNLVMEIFKKKTPATIRSNRRLDPTVAASFLFIQEGKVQILSSPALVNDGTGDYSVVADFGQSLTTHSYVTIPKECFEGFFLTLLPKDEVITFGFPFSTTDPLETEAPVPNPIPEDWEAPQAGAERIGVTLDTPEATPVFVALPTMMPIPPGTHMSPDLIGWSLASEDPVAPNACDFLPALQWIKGAQYIFQRCEGHPIDTNDTLFSLGDVNATPFEELGLFLGGPLSVPLTPMLPNTVSGIAKDHIANQVYAATTNYAEVGGMSNDIYITPTKEDRRPRAKENFTDDNESPLSVVSQLAKELSKVVHSSPTSQKDKDQKKQSSKATNQYRTLLGRVSEVTDGDTGEVSMEFIPATLDPSFVEVLESSTITNATKDYCDLIEAAMSYQCANDKVFGYETDLDKVIFTIPHVAAIRTFGWTFAPRTTEDTNEFLKKLGMDHFAPVHTTSVSYTQCREEQDLIHQQEIVGETNKERLAARSTHLFSAFDLRGCSDVKKTLANFKVFLRAALGPDKFDEQHPPAVWTALLEGIELIHVAEAKRWMRRHDDKYGSRMAFGLIQLFQDIWASFVCISRNATYVQAVSRNDAISPKIFDAAIQSKRRIYQDLQNSISRNSISQFRETPPIFQYYTTEALDDPSKRIKFSDPIRDSPPIKNPPAGKNGQGKSGPSPTGAQGNPARGRTPDQTPRQAKLLPIPPAERLPVLETLFKHTRSGKKARLCRIDASGLRCSFQERCTNYHLPDKFSAIPKESRKQIVAEVAQLPAVRWDPTYYKPTQGQPQT